MNLFVEAMESPNAKSAATLYQRPGTKKYATFTDQPVRAQIEINGRSFAVSGARFGEFFADGTVTEYGDVPNDGAFVSIVASAHQVLLASVGVLYVFELATNTLAVVAAPPDGYISQVEFSDGYFFALVKDSQQFFLSGILDANSWDPLDTTLVSEAADNVRAIHVQHRELWLFGGRTTIPYFDSGNPDFPYEPIQGAFVEQGTAAQFAHSLLDNTTFWIGADSRGHAVAWRASGYTPIRVSNHATEQAWQKYSRVDDATSFSMQYQGHTWWVVTFPSGDATWVYDAATQLWHQWDSWDIVNGKSHAFIGRTYSFSFGKHIVGDGTTGNLYEMSFAYLDDDGKQLRRVRVAGHISNENEWELHSQLIIDMETGLGPIPPLTGGGIASFITLQDSNSVIWQVGVDENLQLIRYVFPSGTPQSIILNDTTNTSSWIVGINTLGELTATATTFSAYPTTFPLVNVTGTKNAIIQIEVVGIQGLLQTQQASVIARDPQVILDWSDDSHTWSNEHIEGCGQAGVFKKRVRYSRLGRSRDRMYRLTMTDPVPMRIMDAYLFASPGYGVTERLSAQLRKGA